MLRHGASVGGAQPTFSVGLQPAEDAGSVTAAVQTATQEDDPYSRMGIFLVAGGEPEAFVMAWHARVSVPAS
jgi:hypothetical protein